MKNKKAQAVIWVIVALAIVIIIALIFVLRNKPKGGEVEINYDPSAYIEQCVRKEVLNVVDKMLPQGGFVNNENFKLYNNVSIEYLCNNKGNYLSCINQHPAYINELREEIKKNIFSNVDDCFAQLSELLKERNIQMGAGELFLEIELAPNRIIAKIDREVSLNGKETSQKIDNWNVEIPSPLYELANTAIEIVNNEAAYCYFEYVGYMVLHPEFIIEKKTLGDSSKLYSIEELKSKKKLQFFVRGCAIPPGL